MSEIFKKRIKKIIIISVCVLGGGYVLFNFVFNFIIRQEAPCLDGIWANEDRSFVLDTDNSFVKITNDSNLETLIIAYRPGVNFQMHYPLRGDTGVYPENTMHRGEIYRIFNYVHVKCEDGCFDTWLQKVE